MVASGDFRVIGLRLCGALLGRDAAMIGVSLWNALALWQVEQARPAR